MSTPPPPIPLAPHTVWMTPAEVDGYRVAGAGPRVLNHHHGQQGVNIMRPSIWGNPYKIGADGDRTEVIAKYRAYITSRPDLINRAQHELRGKDLLCCCAPQACHGDVLLEIANAPATTLHWSNPASAHFDPPDFAVPPPPPPIPLCTWCTPGETGPCVCRPHVLPVMTPEQEAAHEARVIASKPVFEARHGLPPPPIPLAPSSVVMFQRDDTFFTRLTPVSVGCAPPPPPIPLAIVAPPPPPPIPLERPVFEMDTECYKDYWSIGFMNSATLEVTEFEFYPGTRLDIAGVHRMMNAGTIVSFNGKKYDDPMIALALTGADNAQLKFASDAIIQQNVQPWQFEQQFGIKIPLWDTVDLIEVLPGRYNLKMYGGKMHSKKIQDLPIEPSASITPELRPLMRTYRNNDLITTRDAWLQFLPQIELRAEMSKKYGIELRSKSDAQIAEAVIKSELGFYVEKPFVPAGHVIRYKTPDFIRFHTPQLQATLAMIQSAEFYISNSFALTMPKEVKDALIPIGRAFYQFGIGGLHSTEAHVSHRADEQYSLKDHDVASYYPAIIIRCALFPQQMGAAFLDVYKGIVKTRLEAKAAAKTAKKAGDHTAAKRHQVTADALKIVVNGSFGKFGSRYSILYAPDLMLQTTITGQLCLLMLIEELEMAGIQVVQGNTDGVVIKCLRSMEWLKDEIIADWEKRTQFETEMTEYSAIYSESVNSYIAVKPNGETKRKGTFAEPVPIGGSWPSPTNTICADAAAEYLARGTPVEQTIRACTDVRKFVTVQGVTGGGVKYHGTEIEFASTIKGKREQLAAAGWEETFDPKCFTYGNSAPLPLDLAHAEAVKQLRAAHPVRKEYLGKAVRWYYAANEPGAIHYKTNDNLVPRSTGAKPMMELTDAVPADIDWQWYINEAYAHLRNMGVTI